MLADKVKVRAARCEDYNSVMEINKAVYEGFDYLPFHYFEMYHNKKCSMYVGEIDRHVVSKLH